MNCIKRKCPYYFESDSIYYSCQLINERILPDECYGIKKIPDKKEEIICKIARLTQEFNRLNILENLIKEN
jgi:hypothetical protein